MRLVSVEYFNTTRIGVLEEPDGATILDLHHADARLPTDMVAFLAGGPTVLERARRAIALAPPTARIDASAATLRAPVPRPGKVICIGLNYRGHAAESEMAAPERPIVFAKYANSIVGHGQKIVLPRGVEDVDYEAELAVVIGKRARRVAEADALGVVAGYACFNDVSARSVQMSSSQWTLGKSFDTFGPFGPALVTADAIPDPGSLRIRCNINGETLQESSTANLLFSVPQLISYLSEVMTLEPGDVIATGTPEGVGMARTPPRWLRPGDLVCVEIDGVGTLENRVAAEE